MPHLGWHVAGSVHSYKLAEVELGSSYALHLIRGTLPCGVYIVNKWFFEEHIVCIIMLN